MAQFTRGTFYIGPSFSMKYSRSNITDIGGNEGKSNIFNKSGQTELGFALANNLFLGLELYSEQTHNWTSGFDENIRRTILRFGGGPVLGYRIPIVKNLYIPVDGSFIVGPSIYRKKPETDLDPNSSNLFTQVAARFGIEYLIDGKVGVFVKGGPVLVTDYHENFTESDVFVTSRFGVNFYLSPEMRKAHMDKMQ